MMICPDEVLTACAALYAGMNGSYQNCNLPYSDASPCRRGHHYLRKSFFRVLVV